MEHHTFYKKSRFEAPVSDVFKWHSRPGALERLSPPWDPIEVIQRSGNGIDKGAQVKLKMKFGPIPYLWQAEHIEYDQNRMFRDRQIKGPFNKWIHTHIFEPDGPKACFLEDRIDYELPMAPISHFLMEDMIQKRLESIFTYRHHTLAADLHDHQHRNAAGPMTFLISGAGGVIGSVLTPYLTTGGHKVKILVRKTPLKTDQIYWNPINNQLATQDMEGVDAVIHLAGENIGEGRWTEEKKKRIIDSRIKGTALIAEKIALLDPPPKVLVCASAIGYYGNRGDTELTEEDTCGFDFISGVCDEWEKAAAPAAEKGIRVVFLRIGVVLSPLGGALNRLLPPFKLGFGGRIGSGNQYLSWIGIDDAVSAVHHAVFDQKLYGPVNVVAPNPITNLEFTRVLGNVLSRPTMMHVPEKAIELMFGEMGREVPLSSTRVRPQKLIDSGFDFRHPQIEGALKHLLGNV